MSELWVFVLTRSCVSLQLLGIVLSCVFWNLLVDMSESADMVDFKLKKAEVDYGELDLAGAGWCMCLPRDGGYLPVPAAEPELDPIDVHLEKLKKQAPRTHAQLREMQQSRSATGLDEVDVGRKQKREHWAVFVPFLAFFWVFAFYFSVIVIISFVGSCVALLNRYSSWNSASWRDQKYFGTLLMNLFTT